MKADAKWHVFETCFGPSAILFHLSPFRIVELRLPNPALRQMIAGDGRGHIVTIDAYPRLRWVVEQVRGYFRGHEIVDVPWELMDLDGFSKAQKSIFSEVARIPYGCLKTYGQVAMEAGYPGAARFVGNCLAKNPYPVLIPCHRVVRSDGGLGGFGGGLDLKRCMIELEKAGVCQSGHKRTFA